MNRNIDLTKPDLGRITDYWLGGSYHFAADRAAANDLAVRIPEYPLLIRTIRRVQQGLVLDWRAKQIDQFIVFGAGIPNPGMVHEIAPDSRVLYLDSNLDTVQYANQVLPNLSLVRYEWSNHLNFTELQAAIDIHLKPLPVGILAMTTMSMAATEVHTFLSHLNHMIVPNSRLACLFLAQPTDPGERAGQKQLLERYAASGVPIFAMPESQFPALIHPWQIAHSFVPLNGLLDDLHFHWRDSLPAVKGELLHASSPSPLIAILQK